MNEKPSLSDSLAQWRLAVPKDPAFRSAVLQHLDEAIPLSWSDYLQRHLAGCAVAACLVLGFGIWAGGAQAERQTRKDREALASAYLASIDSRYDPELQNPK